MYLQLSINQFLRQILNSKLLTVLKQFCTMNTHTQASKNQTMMQTGIKQVFWFEMVIPVHRCKTLDKCYRNHTLLVLHPHITLHKRSIMLMKTHFIPNQSSSPLCGVVSHVNVIQLSSPCQASKANSSSFFAA
jgi:hypothetical protein